jgi:3-methyladenine DNA glycosylase/8-oxoguanine DNA glycosylase
VPEPAVIARQAPAQLVAFDLAPKRALAMRRCAEEVARGRLDLHGHDLRRLCAIREIGPWTAEMVGLHGQGRMDVVPAGDLGFLKIVGRLATGNPRARADEAEVRGFFERYGEWKGLAGVHLMHAAARGLIPARWSPGPALRPAGTRWSAAPALPARAA